MTITAMVGRIEREMDANAERDELEEPLGFAAHNVRSEAEPLAEFHVPAATKTEAVSGWVCVALFLSIAILCCAVGIGWMALCILPVLLAMAHSAWRAHRLKGRGVVFDESGVGPAMDGERLWTLAWRDYGGFRASPVVGWERMRYPERGGLDILDGKGQRSFTIVMPQGGAAILPLKLAAVEELRRRLPARTTDPLHPVASNIRPPRWGVALGSALVAVAAGIAARIGLADPLSPLFIVGALGTIIGLTAAFLAVCQTALLILWKKGWRPKPLSNPLPELPNEGPTLARHRARHERQPIALEEGRRYRTVEPERRRKELATSVKVGWFLIPVGFAITLAYLAGGISDPKMMPVSALGALTFGGMTGLMIPQVVGAKRLLASVDDALWVHDGVLVAVRSGKEPLTLPLPDATDRQALRRRAFTSSTDALRSSDGTKYYLDRTRLYAASIAQWPD